jgi:hypothetical protein
MTKYSVAASAIALLASASSLYTIHGFSFQQVSLGTNVRRTDGALVKTAFGIQKPRNIYGALKMGVVEDFLAGTDNEKRKKENEKYIAELQTRVEKINAMEPTIEDLGDDELLAKTEEFRKRLTGGEDINGPILEEAFAVVREAAW